MPIYELVNGRRNGTTFNVPISLKNGDTIVLYRHKSKFREKIERNQPGYGYREIIYRFNNGKLYYQKLREAQFKSEAANAVIV